MAVERSQTIDGLRGIAAATVILQHCLEFTPLNKPGASMAEPLAYIFANDVNFGRFGVIVFFFISGFLIPSSIGHQSRPIASFVVGRFFRLYPLYWVSIALALLATAVLGNKMPTVAQTAANLTMFQMVLGFENILYPYWTLLIEHFFYILCVMFFLVGALQSASRMRRIMFASAAAIIVLAIALAVAPGMRFAKPLGELMYTASFLFAMIAGHNVRLAQTRDSFHIPASVPLLFVAVTAFMCVARHMLGGYAPGLSPASVFLSTIAALALFLLALRYGLFGSRPFAYAGQISYGLYLFHGIALWVAVELIGKPADLAHSILLLALVMGLAFVTSAITFNLVEEPFIALGKVMRRRIARGAASAAGAEVLASVNLTAQEALRPFNRASLPSEIES
ncbi:peptidoglycan/LPS O-acetylase OafA/YrhL [Bradyrhizobium sp. USDA 4472]